MARTNRDGRLEKRSNRLKIAQGTRVYKVLDNGVALCYRRTSDSFGTWSVRIRQADGRYALESLGSADDHDEANGQTILTYGDAQRSALARFAKVQKDGGVIRSRYTMGEAVADYLEWFRTNRKSVVETESSIRAHILPAFGGMVVDEIRVEQIRKWHQKLASKPARKRSKLGAAVAYRDKPATDEAKRSRKSTANRILTIFKAILNKAYEDDRVTSRDAWNKVRPFEAVDEPIVRFLKADEAVRLMNASPTDLRDLIHAALQTGARYSELTGASVADYAPDNATLYIRPSKSGKGRHIPLTAEGVALFDKLAMGKASHDALLLRANGSTWGKNHHIRPLLAACQHARIAPAIGFHELRHTYASLLAQAGADLLTISKLLGHADTRVTSRHYAHLCDKTLENAVKRFLPSFAATDKGNVAPIRKRATTRR